MRPVESRQPKLDLLCSRLGEYFSEIEAPTGATADRAISTALSRKAKYGEKGLSKEAQTKLENRKPSNA